VLSDPGARLTVETGAISAAHPVHAEVEQAMAQVRGLLRELLAGAPDWAADGELLPAVRSLVETADQAALRSQADAVWLGEALRAAADGYQAAEAAAERRSR
jgi:hypothetical protein